MFCTVALADDVVYILLGSQWAESAVPLRVLAIVMAIQSVLTTSGTVLMAVGRTDRLFRMSIVTTLGMAVGLMFGAKYGVLGAALGYGVVAVTSYIWTTRLACAETGISLQEMMRELAPYALAAGIAALVSAAVAYPLLGMAPWLRLLCAAAAGVAAYAGAIYLLARRQVAGLLGEIVGKLRCRDGA